MSELKIKDFAVIVRNLVDLGKPELDFEEKRVISCLKDIIIPDTPDFEVIRQVSQTVCSLSRGDISRFELTEIEVLDHPRLYFMPDDEILNLFKEKELLKFNTYCSLHRTGNLIANMHFRFNPSKGLTVDETIENARINLRTLAILIPESLKKHLDFEDTRENIRWIQDQDQTFLVGSLKDLTTEVIQPVLTELLEKTFDLEIPRSRRCLSSTLNQIYKTEPVCKSVEEFITPNQFGKEMFGIGTMDRSYKERTPHLIEEAFSQNLSTDEELGAFTFGLSDLILFDQNFDEIIKITKKKKNLNSSYTAVLYNTAHYSSLLEWVYLEKCIIDRYNRLLSHAISNEKTTPERMLTLQKQSMHDLIVYKAGITPFPSREEFL